jgi:lysine decarboxylase
LIKALKDISKDYYDDSIDYPKYHYDNPFPAMVMRPRVAYQAPLKRISLDEANGSISKEMIMVYPPGIPLIIPGEVFNQNIIDKIGYYIKTGATVLSDYDDLTVATVEYNSYLEKRGQSNDRFED